METMAEDRTSSNNGDGQQVHFGRNASVGPPAKIQECGGRVLAFNEKMQTGVAQIVMSNSSSFAFFHKDVLAYENSDMPPKKGDQVLCDAWMMDQYARIPYLATCVWKSGTTRPSFMKEKINESPRRIDEDYHSTCLADIACIFPSSAAMGSRSVERDEDREPERESRQRSRSRDRRRRDDDEQGHRKKKRKHERRSSRSRSSDRRRSRSRDSKQSGHKRRSYSRERRHRDDRRKQGNDHDRSPRGRRFKEESPDRYRDEDDDREGEEFADGTFPVFRARPGFMRRMVRGRVGMRGRLIRGLPSTRRAGKVVKPAALKLAIGRNVFPDMEDEEESNLEQGDGIPPARGFGGRGRWVRMRGGRVVGHTHVKRFPKQPEQGTSDDRPGLGYSGKQHMGNPRWQRWQQLNRKKDGDDEEDEPGLKNERSLSPISDEDLRSKPGGSSTRTRVSRSPESDADGVRVIIMTYKSDDVGILSGCQGQRILFHINQVWINHATAGFCPFKEIYPSNDITKHLYPGREVRCFTREVPNSKEINRQATAVWLQGVPPNEDILKTNELTPELNFHLGEYTGGTLRSLDLIVPVVKHSTVDAVVHEYISHELGVVRLSGGDGGVALFHLDQVWTYSNNSWSLYKEDMKLPLSEEYLKIGTKVSVGVRKLAHSPNSQLRYQALVLWNKDVCSYNESLDLRPDSRTMEFRQGLQEGGVPPSYIAMYSSPDAHRQLIRSLDQQFDNFKRVTKLNQSTILPVALALNLLPPNWEAKIYRAVDDLFGVIIIQHYKGGNMTSQPKVNITKLCAIFHIEDVYTPQGEKYRKSPDDYIMHLVNQPVDLTARSIVGDGVNQYVIPAAAQMALSFGSTSMIGPVLQAVTVFLKPTPKSNPNTIHAPKPTYLRAFPNCFHDDVPATPFFLNVLLSMNLDLKALNFFEATTRAKMQKEIINGIPLAHFNQTKKNVTTDKQEQIKLLKEMEALDTNHRERLVYGHYVSLPSPPIRPNYPNLLYGVNCSVKVLYQEGLKAKDGLVMCEVPTPAGHPIMAYAYFNASNYKYSLQKEVRYRDIAQTIPVFRNEQLKAHLLLVNESHPVPYVATAVWNTKVWTRFPDAANKLDDLYMQKYERITAILTSQPNGKVGYPAGLVAMQGNPSTGIYNPAVINSFQKPPPQPPKNLWTTQEQLKDVVGKVTSIIDDNYAIAVVKFPCTMNPRDRLRAILLFDTCDLWLGEHTATELNVGLGHCLSVGDYVKVKALKVPESENLKNIRYLATCVVSGRSKREVSNMPLPDYETIDSIDKIHPNKLNNFYQVVSVICANIPGDAEEEARDVSTDEDETLSSVQQSTSSRGPANTANPAPGMKKYAENSDQLREELFSKASLLSIDAFETERENKKLAKATECQNQRRKMGYDKAAREALVATMKLPYQLMWKCPDCDITCAKPGMEKHLTLRSHWDRIYQNFSALLDSIKPPLTLSSGASSAWMR